MIVFKHIGNAAKKYNKWMWCMDVIQPGTAQSADVTKLAHRCADSKPSVMSQTYDWVVILYIPFLSYMSPKREKEASCPSFLQSTQHRVKGLINWSTLVVSAWAHIINHPYRKWHCQCPNFKFNRNTDILWNEQKYRAALCYNPKTYNSFKISDLFYTTILLHPVLLQCVACERHGSLWRRQSLLPEQLPVI